MVMIMATFFYLVPEKHLKYTTKELAKEADINPRVANFILHTSLGRKIAYVMVKKKIKKKLQDEDKKSNQ